VTNTVWITHPETGAVAEVPAAALPMYRQSNWEPLTEEELAAREEAAAEEARAADEHMLALAEQALGNGPAVPPLEDALSDEEMAVRGEEALATADEPTAEDLGAVPGPHTADEIERGADVTAGDAAGRRTTKKGND
jgi:hypothetical protein